MGRVCWNFPALGTNSLSGTNHAGIGMFKGSGDMDGLAREICQNSLDAKQQGDTGSEPVRVEFKLVELLKQDHEMFSEFEKVIDDSIDYWDGSPLKTPVIQGFLSKVKTALSATTVPTLVASDFNTTGLTGRATKDGEISYWDLLVNTEGISIKSNETSAGSFGIGKNAPFAYSSLNTVLYNTLAEDGFRAFEGVAHLVTTQREYNGRMILASDTGKYLYLEDEYTGQPILPEHHCSIAELDVFSRTEIGTDVAIVGFKLDDYPNWSRSLAVSVLKNFVLAIMGSKLEVQIDDQDNRYLVNAETLEDYLFNEFKSEVELRQTRQIFETIKYGDAYSERIVEDGDLTIYVRHDDSYVQSLSRFRSTGMLINTTAESLPHYSVVIVVNDVGDRKLSKALREAEPPQHSEWRGKWVEDNALKQKVYRYLRTIADKVQQIIDEHDYGELETTLDSGVGAYLPDASGGFSGSGGADGLRTDVKIKSIETREGRVLYEGQYQTGASAFGKPIDNRGVKTGTRKRRKRTQQPITVVEPGGGVPGVAAGTGKVAIKTPGFTDSRTFLLGGNKYKLFIESPRAYENVYVQFQAGREDDRSDAAPIKSVKVEGSPLKEVHGNRVGPLSIKEGENSVFLEFEEHGKLALTPSFSMEVRDEE